MCVPDHLQHIHFFASFFTYSSVIVFALGILFLFVSLASSKLWKSIADHPGLYIGIAFVYPIVAFVLAIYLATQLTSVREIVTEGLSLASAGKYAISEYFARHGELPSSNAQAGMASPEEISSYWVESVAVGGQGTMTMTLIETCDSHTVVLAPFVTEGRISWDCRGGTLPAKYRVSDCR